MFRKKTPWDKEWKRLLKSEKKFIKSRAEKKDGIIKKKLSEKVPEKLQGTLDAAFSKAFSLIFKQGTPLIEKTYKKEAIRDAYRLNDYRHQLFQNKKSLRTFQKKATGTGRKHVLISGAAGIGMGLAGMGLPDIPLFTGMLLRNLYEISLHYGFRYESEEEQLFLLLLISGGVSYGTDLEKINIQLNAFIETGRFPILVDFEDQLDQTAKALSQELLYLKFLQGMPLIGAVGGSYDAVYMKRISDYANLKYRRRFLHKHRNQIPVVR